MTLIAGGGGPDGAGLSAALIPGGAVATSASCAFAATVAEALWAEGPVQVAADARLDDREALCRRLGVAADRTDATLIARAWLEWREEAPQALVGDYAFALYDARSEQLWLVRDALGFRPLSFVARAGMAAFCSLPSRLAEATGSRGVTPELAAARAFASRTSPHSWFAGVEQVQPGERVLLRPGAASRTAWWQPSTAPRFTGTREDLLAATRTALEAATADRIAGQTRVASHLSAGLDSMAVTVTAADILPPGGTLVAITARPAPGHPQTCPGDRLPDETGHAASVAARYPAIRHLSVDAGARRIADDLASAAKLFDQPLTNAVNYGWFAESVAAARDSGAQRLLVAQLGNFAFSPKADAFWWPLLQHEGLGRFASEWRHSPRRRAPLAELARRIAGRIASPADVALAAIRAIDPGLFLKGLAQQGVVLVDPTADRRLIELTLGVPQNLLVHGGDRRWLPRRLLCGRVPDAVLDEPRRGFQAADWLGRLRAEAAPLAAMLEAAGSLAAVSFDDSLALLRAIEAQSGAPLDSASRIRLAPDLALAAFLLSVTPERA